MLACLYDTVLAFFLSLFIIMSQNTFLGTTPIAAQGPKTNQTAFDLLLNSIVAFLESAARNFRLH